MEISKVCQHLCSDYFLSVRTLNIIWVSKYCPNDNKRCKSGIKGSKRVDYDQWLRWQGIQ